MGIDWLCCIIEMSMGVRGYFGDGVNAPLFLRTMELDDAEASGSTGLELSRVLGLSGKAKELSCDFRNGGIITGGSFIGGNGAVGALSLVGLKSQSKSCLLQFIPVPCVNRLLKGLWTWLIYILGGSHHTGSTLVYIGSVSASRRDGGTKGGV